MTNYLLFFFIVAISGCATSGMERKTLNESLTKFAYANCLMWYFESKKYNTDDIRAISGGIVETSDASIDKFQEIALFIKDYDPKLETKQDIDKQLLRCFSLESSEELQALIKN